MAGLNHQACGVLDLASASRCPDRALLSKHSNQNEKPDLGQESDAHDRDRKEHVARRERVHECLAPSEAPGSKSFRRENVSVPNADGARCVNAEAALLGRPKTACHPTSIGCLHRVPRQPSFGHARTSDIRTSESRKGRDQVRSGTASSGPDT